MLSMIADEESDVSSPGADNNGNKQLLSPALGGGDGTTGATLRPSSKTPSSQGSSVDKDGNDKNSPSVAHRTTQVTAEELGEWIVDVNGNNGATEEPTLEQGKELTTIYLPNIGIITVDAISEV